ncbi:MAG: S10 family peptidase [Bacteroidia bacterium]
MRTLFLLLFSATVQLAIAQTEKTGIQWPAPVSTKHSITLNGQKINFTATAGHQSQLNDKGEKIADIFYIAYQRDGADPNKRPITFSFNGGPGSSSVWLHMGALGPKRILMTEDGGATRPPYELTDNPYTWLAFTDLVFIDPVETGYSRPAEGTDKKEFTGYSEDLRSVGDFIYKYISSQNRWQSPKFLVGESYGTTRAAGLSGYLQDRHGMYLNGIVLVSAVLNFQTIRTAPGNDLPYPLFLPGFAAAAWYHGLLDKTRFPDLASTLRAAEAYALGDYNSLLMKGDQLTEAEAHNLSSELSSLTGLSPSFLKAYHYRINTQEFTKELLRARGETIGRFDATVKGRDRQDGGDSYEYDPSYNLSIYGPYTAAINQHLRTALQYPYPEQVYEILTGKVHPWNYGEATNRYLDNSGVLAAAIHKNLALQVLICSGYYDLATPYFATDYTVNHMFLRPELRGNVQTRYYEGGHMMYTRERDLRSFSMDVRQFYDRCLK